MAILLTGAAGFIGTSIAKTLLDRNEEVIGVDHFGDEDGLARLKRDRARHVSEHPSGRFSCLELDIIGPNAIGEALGGTEISAIVHLAAHPGVRSAEKHARFQARANLVGHAEVLELCREREIQNLVYASTSAVYGENDKVPSSIFDAVEQPISLYAATKRADELMTRVYSHLYGLRATGLRFFTVYGPWGRPDAAPWLFTSALLERRPLQVFGYGKLKRDFTYVDDVAAAILASLDRPAKTGNDEVSHRVYNIGNESSVSLLHFIAILEEITSLKAELCLLPKPPEDVFETCADITESRRDLGFEPRTSLEEGLPRFVSWYREYHGL